MTTARFNTIPAAPLDPIIRLWEAVTRDPRPEKLNLVLGVYTDENGKVPRLQAVQEAERRWVAQGLPKTYRPIEGSKAYTAAVQQLLFGDDSEVLRAGRATTLQSVGGTGALKIGADVLSHLLPGAQVAVSNPSWENHRSLFTEAGFQVVDYPYYTPGKAGVQFDAMKDFLATLPPGSIVVLHACCHNPTGNDLSPAQWRELVPLLVQRELVPFVDLAYQGFGDGIAADGLAVQLFAETGCEFFIASSFSKSFSLYGERVGALTAVARDAAGKAAVEGLAKRLVRTNYSNPPTHGAMLVETVLGTPELRQAWEAELGHMRERIRGMRQRLVAGLNARVPGRDFGFISEQKGMFSYSGLTAAEVDRLQREYAIFAVDTGRICVAALNDHNIDRVIEAISDVVSPVEA